MDGKTATEVLEQVRREKQAFIYGNPSAVPASVAAAEAAAQAAQQSRAATHAANLRNIAGNQQPLAAAQSRAAALDSVGGVALAGLGSGAAFMGIKGLLDLARRRAEKSKQHLHATAVPVGEPREARAGDNWWSWPAHVMAGTAGVLGGIHGVKALLEQRRLAEAEANVADAKAEFEEALRSHYRRQPKSTIPTLKTAADVGVALDGLYDQLEKRAIWEYLKYLNPLHYAPDSWGDNAMGAYLSYAIPSAALAGYGAYHMASGEVDSRKRMRKAMAQRAIRRQNMQPAELYAAPAQTIAREDQHE